MPSPVRVASRYVAASKVIGEITAYAGHDTKYGSSLKVELKGSRILVTVKSWSQIGGMDSPFGAGEPEETARKSVSADPRAIKAAISQLMGEDSWLDGAKRKDFLWHLPWKSGYSASAVKGLTLSTIASVLDAWSGMDRAQWEATWVKPKAKLTGGPFAFDSSTNLKEVASQLAAQGHPLAPTRASPMGVDRAFPLKNGRRYKQLVKMLEASADSVRESRTRDGWPLYIFDFGDLKVNLGKVYFTYPINGNKWSLWVSRR